jgi:hypothetical protein
MDSPNALNPWLKIRLKPLVLPPTNQLGHLFDGYLNVLPRSNGEMALLLNITSLLSKISLIVSMQKRMMSFPKCFPIHQKERLGNGS